jgi:hypothetical protein
MEALLMKGWQESEMRGVTQTPHITVHKVSLDWEIEDLKCWELIIGFPDGRLEWAYTYSPILAVTGPHDVEFYKDKSQRRCIRVPKKG